MPELTYDNFRKVIEKVLAYVAAQYYYVEDLEKVVGNLKTDIAKAKKYKPDFKKAKTDARKIARSERRGDRYEKRLLNGLHELYLKMPQSSAKLILRSLMDEIAVEESTLIKDAAPVHGGVMSKLSDLGHALKKGDEIGAQRALDELKRLTEEMEKFEKAMSVSANKTKSLLRKMSNKK